MLPVQTAAKFQLVETLLCENHTRNLSNKKLPLPCQL